MKSQPPVIEIRPLALLGSAAPDAARFGAYRVEEEREEELGSYASVEGALDILRLRFPDFYARGAIIVRQPA